MKYDHRITGQVIGRLRVQQGLSQEELAKKAGIARSHLAMIENGKKSASVETLWKIAEAFEIRLSILISKAEKEFEKCPPV